MSFNSSPVFTAAGENLLARALTGDTLTFTTMQMGDGILASASIRDMTALVNPVSSVEISTLRHRDNFATVSGQFTNQELASGFYWREIGLFAADPDAPDDRSRDILYCYQNAGDLADYIPASGSELITKRISIAAAVSNATTVSAVLSAATSAESVGFDNSNTGMKATDVQAALEELYLAMGEQFTEADIKNMASCYAKSIAAHNLVTDGGFECGTAYWRNPNNDYYALSASDSEHVHGHRGLRISATAPSDGSVVIPGAKQMFFGSNRLGHVIYFACMAKAAVGKSLFIALAYGGAGSSNFTQQGYSTGSWARISRRVELSAGYYPNGFVLGFSGAFSAGDEAFFDDVLVVDLTDLFGADNEPTKEWCDENIEYFNTSAAVNEVKSLVLISDIETVVTT